MFEGLKYVRAVAQYRNFTAAAAELCITQPALSIAVARIEAELGVILFDRRVKPVQLTDAGEQYLRAAAQAEDVERALHERLHQGKVGGEIRIGAAGIAMQFLLPAMLKAYAASCPQVRTILYEDASFILRDRLYRGELDCIIYTELNADGVVSVPLFTNRILYAVRKELLPKKLSRRGLRSREVVSGEYPPSAPAEVPFTALKDVPYLSLQPGNELYARAEYYFAWYKCRPRIGMHFNQQLTAYRFARQGFGGTFVSDTLVRFLPDPRLRLYVMDVPEPTRRICICYRQDRHVSAALQAFIDLTPQLFRDGGTAILCPQENVGGR